MANLSALRARHRCRLAPGTVSMQWARLAPQVLFPTYLLLATLRSTRWNCLTAMRVSRCTPLTAGPSLRSPRTLRRFRVALAFLRALDLDPGVGFDRLERGAEVVLVQFHDLESAGAGVVRVLNRQIVMLGLGEQQWPCDEQPRRVSWLRRALVRDRLDRTRRNPERHLAVGHEHLGNEHCRISERLSRAGDRI